MRGAERKKSLVRRKLRRNSTDAEMKLWLALRARRLGGFKFIRQGKIGPYIADFVCRDKSITIEVDGGQYAESKQDKVRDMALAAKGYRVVRFWNSDVLQNIGSVLEHLYAELLER